jgi:transcriptional regulator with XRE-family HTH domain
MAKSRRHPNELLRQERLNRGWSLDQMAEHLRVLAFRLGQPEPGVDGNMISRWERGLHQPAPRYVQLLSLLLDRSASELALRAPDESPTVARAGDTFELARKAAATDIDPAALESLERAVDRLSREYSSISPTLLLPRVQQRLWQVDQALRGRTTLSQHRQLLRASGWLHLLLAVLHYDVGDREAAEVSRDAALYVGRDVGDPVIQAWAFETPAYFALFEDRARDAIELIRAGREFAPEGTSVAAALHMQEGRAWARLGDKRAAEEALGRGLAAIERLPVPEHPEHHFVFDPAKFAYYASTAYAWLGMSAQTERYARQVIGQNDDPRRANFWPGRVRGAYLDLALALAKEGRLDEASELGVQALDDCVLRSWIMRRATHLHRLLVAHPELRSVKDFDERYLLARHEGP